MKKLKVDWFRERTRFIGVTDEEHLFSGINRQKVVNGLGMHGFNEICEVAFTADNMNAKLLILQDDLIKH